MNIAAHDLPSPSQQQMITQQVRCGAVSDQRILEAMRCIPREAFVPRDLRAVACADYPLPLPGGQTMLTPLQAGHLLQALQPTPDEQVLEIGTGSGYVTACLAQLSAHVTSIELRPELHTLAQANLDSAGIRNQELRLGDGFELAALEYDIIALTGSLSIPDPRFEQWLRIGGRLFVTLGDAPCMRAWRITRTGAAHWHRECLFETVVQPLDRLPATGHFRF